MENHVEPLPRQGEVAGRMADEDSGPIHAVRNGDEVVAAANLAPEDNRLVQFPVPRDATAMGSYDHYRPIHLLFFVPSYFAAGIQVVFWLLYLALARPKKPKRGQPEEERMRRAFLWKRGPLSLFFSYIHPYLGEVWEGVTSSGALHAVYTAKQALRGEPGWRAAVARLWFTIPPSEGTLNRFKRVYSRVSERLEALAPNGGIKIASLAAGSAAAILFAVAAFFERHPAKRGKVKVYLVDLNRKSLQMAEEIAKSCGLDVNWGENGCTVNLMHSNLRPFLTTQPAHSFDFLEFVGFLDYRSDRDASRLLRQALGALRPGGWLITSLMLRSVWMIPLRWVIGWPWLRYRSKHQAELIVRQAVLSEGAVSVWTDPLGQHLVAEVEVPR